MEKDLFDAWALNRSYFTILFYRWGGNIKMVGLWGDTKKIEELYLKHTSMVNDCLLKFKKTIEIYIEEGETDQVTTLAEQVHKLETDADTIRRDIIHLMINKSYLMPNTRRDFLTLLEFIDKVADFSEAVLDYLLLQSMDITDIGKKKLKEMLLLTVEQFELLKKSVSYLFSDIDKAFELVVEIDRLESEVDKIERLLITRLSNRDDLDWSLKILYRDFLTMIANISDKIEDAGDEIEIIVAMRKI